MEGFLDDLVLPEDIKPLYISLANHLVYLNMKWGFYKELFQNKDNSILLAETARTFFVFLEQSLLYDITLAICHLSDHSEYTKRSGETLVNLSLETLMNRCGANQIVRDSFKEFKKKSKPFMTLRNRLIAHRDLDTNLNPKVKPLPRIDETKVGKALELAADVLSGISKQYGNTQQITFVPLVSTGTSDLIYWLNEGKESYKRKMKALKEGRIPEGL